MRLNLVRLRTFRNVYAEDIEFGEGVNVLWGDNGEGKTNILESVYFLSYCRPLRGESIRNLVQWGEEGSRVDGVLEEGGVLRHLSVSLSGKGGVEASVDGEKSPTIRDYVGTSQCVCFQGDDARALFGPPQARRKMLDQLCYLVQPGFAEEYVRYVRIVRQRNRVLRQIGEGKADFRLLDTMDEVLVKAAKSITEVRKRVFNWLKEKFVSVLEMLGGGYAAHLEGEFEFDERKLETERVRDIERGYTSYGPHRQDFGVSVGGRDARIHASTGQKRLLALAFRLSQAIVIEDRRYVKPVVLLDDITSEIDGKRRERLLALVAGMGNQTLLTTTDWRLLPGNVNYSRVMKVQGGTIV